MTARVSTVAVSTVVRSASADVAVGDLVYHQAGFREYALWIGSTGSTEKVAYLVDLLDRRFAGVVVVRLSADWDGATPVAHPHGDARHPALRGVPVDMERGSVFRRTRPEPEAHMHMPKLSMVIGTISALAVIGAPAAAEPAELGPQAVVQTIAVPGGPCGDAALGTNCQAYFPDLERDPHGDADDLLMVYRWSSEHVNRPSQLRMMRSRDGGATWQQATPFIVADYADLDYRDPSLTALDSGRLLLSYFVSDGQTGGVIQSQVKRRDTDNAAFSAPVQVFSSTIPRPVTSAKIVEMTNGQLLIPLYGTPSGGNRQHAVVVASVDGGVTWDGRITGRQKTIASNASYHYQEPAIAEVAPGHVRAIIRVATSTGASTNAVQTDSYGNTYLTTWATPSSLGVMMHGPEILTVPGTSYVPYLWGQPNAATGPTNRPTRIAVRRGQVTWQDTPRHTLYDPATTYDSSYPGTVALDGSRLVTVVYDEARRAAIVLRYTIADVD